MHDGFANALVSISSPIFACSFSNISNVDFEVCYISEKYSTQILSNFFNPFSKQLKVLSECVKMASTKNNFVRCFSLAFGVLLQECERRCT